MSEMWSMGLPYQLMLIAFVLGAPAAVMYPIVLTLVKWNTSRIGRSMMFKGLALAFVFIQGFLSLYQGEEEWYPWFVFGVTTWLMFAVWYQFTTVIHTIRDGQIEDRMKNPVKEARSETERKSRRDAGEPGRNGWGTGRR